MFHLMWDFLFEVLYKKKITQGIKFRYKGVLEEGYVWPMNQMISILM